MGLSSCCNWRTVLAALVALVALGALATCRADTTWDYAVQISAKVQTNPPQIFLSWPQDDNPVASYTVNRKAKSVTSWGAGTLLPGTATNYTDFSVADGSSYEYQVTKVDNSSALMPRCRPSPRSAYSNLSWIR
jgi:hypothetical protein